MKNVIHRLRPDRLHNRRLGALDRRQADLARYEKGDFERARNRTISAVARAKEDVANLEAKLA